MDMAYVKVYADWTKATAKLKDAEKGRLIDAMVVYATTGEDRSDSLSGNEQYLFPMFQASIDRDREAFADYSKKQRENGSKGGRPKKNPAVFDENPKNPAVFDENPKNPAVFDENPKNPAVFDETQKTHIKEKEKEKEVVVPPYPPTGGTTTTTSYVGDNLRGMTGGNWEELRSYLEDGIPMELVNHAVDEAAANGKRTWAYVRRILNRYLEEGITSVAQAKNTTPKPKDPPPQIQKRKWVGED